MAKDEAKKRSDIESKRATKKATAKDIKEERFRKEAKKSPNTWIFFVFRKNCYICPYM